MSWAPGAHCSHGYTVFVFLQIVPRSRRAKKRGDILTLIYFVAILAEDTLTQSRYIDDVTIFAREARQDAGQARRISPSGPCRED